MPQFNINGQQINIEGLSLSDCPPAIAFPSGLIPPEQPGRDLDALLIQCNSQFGFNNSPHTFNCTFIPQRGDNCNSFHGASGQAPPIGSIIGFNIGEFLVSGLIKHSEYNIDATGGTIINIVIEDLRKCLDKISILTEDTGINPGSGIISIARARRIVHGFNNNQGLISEQKFREYRKILSDGCTYPQILEAIQLAIDQGEIVFDINSIPTIVDLEANLGGDASAIRFKFDITPLSEVITRVLEACAYDWYWSLSENKVNIINRKYEFNLQENQLLDIVSQLGAGSGLDYTMRLGFGNDEVQQARRVRLLGANQEGWINSQLLSPLDGLDTPASGIIFYPAWNDLIVQFIDANGILRQYQPRDIELQAALKGIEHWSYFKKYQTAPTNFNLTSPGFGLPADAGSVAAQHPDFQSRIDPAQPLATLGGNESGNLRLINNRRDATNNWVLNFYNRIRDHANRFFGKAYVASGLLVNVASGAFRLANGAWGNIENQIEGQNISPIGSSGIFIDGYEINRDLSPLAPFKGTDDKISAYCVLPSGTIYGPDGDEPPASFGQWTEDYNIGNTPATSGRRPRTGEHYIPVQLSEVGQLPTDPRDPAETFSEFPEGTVLAELPVIAGSGFINNNIFANLVTLAEAALDANSSGLFDVTFPSFLIQPYNILSGVAVPIISTYRYGLNYPSPWVSGNLTLPCDAEFVVIDEQYAPWNFSPQGTITSIRLMEDRAYRRLQGLIAPAATSRFANIEVVGFPKISYDSFANQSPDSQGRIGLMSHGISDFNFNLSASDFRSTYKIASYFSEFGREAPLGERQRSILNGIINPIDTDALKLAQGDRFPPRPSPNNPIGGIRTSKTTVTIRARIQTVNNALTFTNTPDIGTSERYRGTNPQLYQVPPIAFGSTDPDFSPTGGAICLDGFLNIDDEAIYHVDEFRLSNGQRRIQRYFSGGRPFSNGVVVFVSGVGSTSSTFDVAIEGTNPLRRLVNVPLLNGAVNIGERTTLVARADNATPRSLGRSGVALEIDGIFLNPGGNASVPVQVINITNPGTSGALLTVQKLNSSGILDVTGETFTDVVPIPNPEFVILQDKGIYLTSSALNSANNLPTIGKFFFSNRGSFLRFS